MRGWGGSYAAHMECEGMGESEDLKSPQLKAGWTAWDQWAEERDRLYAVLEATSDGIVLFDHEGRLLLANLTFRKFFGLIPENLAHEDPAATLGFLKSRAKREDARAVRRGRSAHA